MLLIVEIIMFITGVWALAMGRLPSILFGGPQYKLEGRGVRLLGIILMIPLPFAFIMGMALALLGGVVVDVNAFWFEILLVLGCGILAMIVSRQIRIPVTEQVEESREGETETEVSIGKKTQGSLIYVLLGGLGFPAIVLCPLAFIRTSQALRMIDEYGVGEQYRNTANVVRILSVLVLLFWASIFICLLITIVILPATT